MVTCKITRTTEGLDLSLICQLKDGVACLLDSFWSCQSSLSLSQPVSVVVTFPSNASRRRRPSPFTLLLLNLVFCMELGLVAVSV
jgi:hypothetical protein